MTHTKVQHQTELWSRVEADRRSPTPLYSQIANLIRHRIATNEAPAQSQLPSVREMARLLKVTPATIARAYQLLQTEGLIETVAGLGTVIADVRNIEHEAHNRSIKALERAIDDTISSLLRMEFSPEDIRAAVERRLRDINESRSLIVVAAARPVARKYVNILQKALGSDYDIRSVLAADIRAAEPEALRLLHRADRCVTLLSLHQIVKRLIEPFAIPISILLTQLSLETVQRLEGLAGRKDTRVLLVAEEYYRMSVMATLAPYFDPEVIRVADSLEPDDLQAELEDADTCIYSLGVSDIVSQLDPKGVDMLELVFEVRADSLERFLKYMRSETGQAAGREVAVAE